jgi:DNA-directed RNA polymerase specialized sigma24 family protein
VVVQSRPSEDSKGKEMEIADSHAQYERGDANDKLMGMNNQELCRLVRRGNEIAFYVLLYRYHRALLFEAMRYVNYNKSEAEDILYKAEKKLYIYMQREIVREFICYARTVIRSVAIDMIEEQNTEETDPVQDEEEDFQLGRLSHKIVLDFRSRLDPYLQEVFGFIEAYCLLYPGRIQPRVIAAILGLERPVCYTYIWRVRRSLRQYLREKGINIIRDKRKNQ